MRSISDVVSFYISYLIHVAVILCGAQESDSTVIKDGVMVYFVKVHGRPRNSSLFLSLKIYGIVIIDCAGCGVFDL